MKGVYTSCFWLAEHMQCDARVDGRGPKSTHAWMSRVARRTRMRTGTVRKRNLAVMRIRTYPSSEGRLQGYALWSDARARLSTYAATDEYWRRPTHAIKVTHVFTRRSGHRSPFLAVCARQGSKHAQSSRGFFLQIYVFWFVWTGPAVRYARDAILPCAGETMLVFRGWCLASHVLGACVYEAL